MKFHIAPYINASTLMISAVSCMHHIYWALGHLFILIQLENQHLKFLLRMTTIFLYKA